MEATRCSGRCSNKRCPAGGCRRTKTPRPAVPILALGVATLGLGLAVGACEGPTGPSQADPPPGSDVSEPFPIDANQFTTDTDGSPFPTYPDPASDFQAFRDHLGQFADRVPEWFPSLVAVYTSFRSYGGFANSPGRGEPLSYEEGHALNDWLADNRLVGGVWYGWGPYLWAPSCDAGVNGSGICYVRDDYVADGVHPSTGGREKIAGLIHQRLLEENWYRR